MPDRRQGERRGAERRNAGPKIRTTRDEVLNAVKVFQWKGQLTDWTTVIEDRELPARTLLLRAAKAVESNSITSEEAAVILSDLGFEVRYKGATIPWEDLPA
jgi:hypothetical protein